MEQTTKTVRDVGKKAIMPYSQVYQAVEQLY